MPDSDPKDGRPFMTEDQWRETAKGMLKAELARQGLTYGDLAKLLAAIGVDETEISIRNKLSRGAFPFVFALQTMEVLDLQFVIRRKGEGYALNLPIHQVRSPADLDAFMKTRGK